MISNRSEGPPVVLIVDDDQTNRKVIEALLSGEGYEIRNASSGSEALESITRNPPDTILLDVMMPVMDGYEVARIVKNNPATAKIPIVMVTALDDRESRLLGLNAGADDFLSKPVDGSELRIRVRNHLRLKAFSDFLSKYSQQLETEVKARTNELQLSEAFLRSILDALPMHIGIVGPEGQMVAVNKAWKEFEGLNGFSGDKFIEGANYLAVCDGGSLNCKDAAAAARGLRQVISGELREFEMEYPCNSSSENRWFYMRAAPFGTTLPTSVVVTHFNITERRLMAAQLLHKQKMESMGELAGSVAHDFNNILTVIRGFSDLLVSDNKMDVEQLRDMREITDAADRAGKLAGQLLSFSRKETVSSEVLDLNVRLLKIRGMLDRLIPANVELVFALNEAALPINIDPTYLDQVIMNLVLNARDAMAGSGVLKVHTFMLLQATPECDASGYNPPTGNYAILEVSDSGIGMCPETVTRIFEPFFTTKGVGEGTGLGLSTVFGIVNQANGCIRVESIPGEGTTFRLYFPLSSANLSGAKTVEHTTGEQPALRSHILFVDDEPVLQKLGTRILEQKGFKVTVASNGIDAMALCAASPREFDLALVDVVMPGMGGGALVAELSAAYPAMKVIMMSGFNDDDSLRHWISERDTPFIDKPYSAEELVAKVRGVLGVERRAMKLVLPGS